jgi:uncharacterized membrane protein YkoI
MTRISTYTFKGLMVAGLLALVPLALGADGREPAEALSLVDIVAQLEEAGYGPFHEVSRDGKHWEVEAQKGKNSYELKVDAVTGEILSQHRDDPERQPPKDALKLSDLLNKVIQDYGTTDIDEVSFERRYWEIELVKDGVERELHVDPLTGKIISDREDN